MKKRPLVGMFLFAVISLSTIQAKTVGETVDTYLQKAGSYLGFKPAEPQQPGYLKSAWLSVKNRFQQAYDWARNHPKTTASIVAALLISAPVVHTRAKMRYLNMSPNDDTSLNLYAVLYNLHKAGLSAEYLADKFNVRKGELKGIILELDSNVETQSFN